MTVKEFSNIANMFAIKYKTLQKEYGKEEFPEDASFEEWLYELEIYYEAEWE